MNTSAPRSCRAVPPAASPLAQAGLTLIELMISLVLSMLVVAAAIMLLLSSKSSYTVEDDTVRLLDAGRFSIENISRAVRQTAYENLGSPTVPIVSQPTDTPNIFGSDAQTLPVGGVGIPAPVLMSSKHSDVLQLRFFGSSDSSIVNCSGIAVSAPTSVALTNAERGWSVYFVRLVAGAEPELHCGYLNASGAFQSVAIASGVESFQVLYGIDQNGDGVPDRFVTASTVLTLDPVTPPTAAASLWKKVVAVKIALLLRGGRTQRADAQNDAYDLFGASYNDPADLGSRYLENAPGLPADERSRTRKVFSTTIQLRNRAAGGNMAPLP